MSHGFSTPGTDTLRTGLRGLFTALPTCTFPVVYAFVGLLGFRDARLWLLSGSFQSTCLSLPPYIYHHIYLSHMLFSCYSPNHTSVLSTKNLFLLRAVSYRYRSFTSQSLQIFDSHNKHQGEKERFVISIDYSYSVIPPILEKLPSALSADPRHSLMFPLMVSVVGLSL